MSTSFHPQKAPASPPQADVSAALERLEAARDFRASPRLRGLLRHLVESWRRGESERLNQRSIAADVFGRRPFDPTRDAIVRVEMSKLRKALKAYYAGTGATEVLRIGIPLGSYVPRFVVAGARTHDPVEQAPRAAEAAPTPSIAVHAFVDLSALRDPGPLTLAIREETMASLVRAADIPVVDAADAAGGRSSRFQLLGTVQREGSAVRVTARLVDSRLGRTIWSASHDRDLEQADVLRIRSEIARSIVAEVADAYSGEISCSLIQELEPDPGADVRVYEALLRYWVFLGAHDEVAYRRWRQAGERALRAEVGSPLALATMADALRAGYALGFASGEDPAEECLELLGRAVQLAPDSGFIRSAEAWALLHARKLDALDEVAGHLITSGRYAPGHVADGAMTLALAGQWGYGSGVLRDALAEMRHVPHFFPMVFFLQAYRGGDHVAALKEARAFAPSRLFWRPFLLAAALGKTGDPEAGARALMEAETLRPGLSANPRRFLRCYLAEDDLVEELLAGAVLSGLPEPATPEPS